MGQEQPSALDTYLCVSHRSECDPGQEGTRNEGKPASVRIFIADFKPE